MRADKAIRSVAVLATATLLAAGCSAPPPADDTALALGPAARPDTATWFEPAPEGLRALRPGLDVELGDRALSARARTWRVALAPAALGRATGLAPLPTAQPRIDGATATLARGPVTEWVRSDAAGLQQGFVVHDPPAGDGPLVLRLEVDGLQPEVLPDGRAAALVDDDGVVRARYQGLRAWDATDRPLRAWMEAGPCADACPLSLHVDVEGAVWPVTIDPWLVAEATTLAPTALTDGAQFGAALALDGDTLVVGAPAHGDPGSQTGAAWVYVRDGQGAWSVQDTLVPATAADLDRFGAAVALSGDRALIAAPDRSGSGSAFLFERDGAGTWSEGPELVVDGTVDFGHAVALTDDNALVGDPESEGAWIFARDLGGLDAWGQAAALTASDAVAGDRYGTAVALRGRYAAVGAPENEAGHVYVYDRQAATPWSEAATFTDGIATAAFGRSLALTAERMAVGANEDTGGGSDSGAVYLYDVADWSPVATTWGTNAGCCDSYGVAVALQGDRMVAGARAVDQAHLHEADQAGPVGGWGETQVLAPQLDGAFFGAAVGLADAWIAVGAPDDLDGSVALYEELSPPTLVTNAGLALDEGTTATLSASLLEATDPDNTAAELQYEITGLPTEGTLYRWDSNQAENVALGLSGVFTQADVDAGLITYTHDGVDPVDTADSFDFTLSDGTGHTLDDTVAITIEPVNDPPVEVASGPVTLDEGATKKLLTSDLEHTDPEGGALTYTIDAAPVHGTLFLGTTALGVDDTFTQADLAATADDSNLSYAHDGTENFSDTLAYTVADPGGGERSGSLAFDITSQFDPPVVTTGTLTVDEGDTARVTAGALDATDPDSAPSELVYTLTTAPSHGILAGGDLGVDGTFTQADLDAGDIAYTHGGDEQFSDSFSVSVTDGTPDDTADDSGTVTLDISPVDEAPVVTTNTGASVDEGATLAIANTQLAASDPEGDPVTYTVTAGPDRGTLSATTFTQGDIDAGNLTYTDDDSEPTGSSELDGFRFTVADPAGNTSPEATFEITVNAVDEPPVLASGVLAVDEGATITVTGGTLQATDPDTDPIDLVYTLTAAPSHGTLSGGNLANGSGTFTQADLDSGAITYAHDDTENHTDGFSVSVTDGAPDDTDDDTATVAVDITPVNDLPVIAANTGHDAIEASSTTLLAAELQATDAEDGPADLTWRVDTPPAHADLLLRNPDDSQTLLGVDSTFTQADIDAGDVAYDHDGSETTADEILLTVLDTDGASIGLRLAVTIAPTNDAPTVAAAEGITVDESATALVPRTALRIEDVDDLPSALEVRLDDPPEHGTLRKDGVILGSGSTFTQADIDDARITYRHAGGSETADAFLFSARDDDDEPAEDAEGSTTFTFPIDVTPVDDPPVLEENLGLTVDEGASATIPSTRLEVSDPDDPSDQIVFVPDPLPAHGTLSVDEVALTPGDTFTQADIDAGLLAYTHDDSETTADSFDFTVGDAIAATFAITIDPVDDPPSVPTNEGLVVTEGDDAVLGRARLQAIDSDDEPGELTWTVDTAPTAGTLLDGGTALGATDTFTQADVDDGVIRYAHAGGEGPSDAIDLTVRDPIGQSVSITVQVTVEQVDDPPVLVVNAGLSLLEGGTTTVDTTALEVTDPDDPVQYTLTAVPAHGTLTLDDSPLALDGTFTQADLDAPGLAYTHDGSETTADAFAFSVSDGTNPPLADTFEFDITPVDDPPEQVTNLGLTVAEGATAGLGDTVLSHSDPDTLAIDLDYRVVAVPAHGDLLRLDVVLGVDATFSQYDLEQGLIAYRHDGSEGDSDHFDFVVTDGTTDLAQDRFDITVTPVDDPPTVTANEPVPVDEGETATITTAHLDAADPDTADADLQFAVDAHPDSGTLVLAADGGDIESPASFSLQDLVDGALAYTHDGSETEADQVVLTLSDGTTEVGPFTLGVAVQPVDDPPVLVTNAGLELKEGEAAALGAAHLEAADPDTPADGIDFTVVTLPAHGAIAVDGEVLASGGSFTQADLDAGAVVYTHDDTETSTDLLEFTLGDATTTLDETFQFDVAIDSFNDPPAVAVNEVLEVPEGGTATLTDAHLQVVDPDDPPESLVFTVEAPPGHGELARDGAVLASGDTFTQADVTAGLLVYTHGGDEASADTFSFTVADPGGASVPTTVFSIEIGDVNDPPVIEVNEPLVVSEGGSTPLARTHLSVVDEDDPPTAIRLVLDEEPVHGTLKRSAAPLLAGDAFTMDDLDEALISYAHDGSETTSDSFVFSASDDGGATLDPATFTIEVIAVNDAPVAVDDGPYHLEQDAILVVEAADGVLVNDTDVEGDPLEAILSHGVVNGTLELQGDGGFTYEPHPGFAGADRFTYLAFDGEGASNVASVLIRVEPVFLDDSGLGDTGDTGEGPGPCSCASGPADGSGAPLLLLLLLAARRRR